MASLLGPGIQVREVACLAEITFVFLKPEAVRRGLMGEIIARIERKGLRIRAMRLHRMSREEAERLYDVHRGKEFFDRLVRHVTSGPVLLMVVEGPRAVEAMRKLIGATDPVKAQPGTIRGDYGLDITQNVIHAADSPERAVKEMRIFFTEEEVKALWEGVE
ncbi:nucleoside-diphosphate kinase [Candidatus Bathyarchaeota archaeon ex4484_135]|nr:MAG: nucleoside-diphosphate kinase [Candidatus Bathyarchaeota archaeon ex4484_135]RLI89238.1 MAG: nucleoside-diphosphate kinase [Candidatus Altiarchaeales archaeon]